MKKSNVYVKLIWLVLAALIAFLAIRIYYRLTDDFQIANITYEMPYDGHWDSPPLTEDLRVELKNLFSRPFTYVGKGAQSYVFLSGDKKYVIKFFKFKHLKPNALIDALPELPYLSQYRDFQRARKKKLLLSVFDGYNLAWLELGSASGILFLHLNKTNNLGETVTLIDKIGRKHLVTLDSTIFVIQENVQTTRSIIQNAIDSGNISAIKRKIAAIFDLYRQEYARGIYDRDHGVMHNTGFIGDRVLHLDAGKLTKDNRMKDIAYWRPDLEKIGKKFAVWFKVNHPEEYPEIIAFMEKELSNAFGKNFQFEKRD